MPVISESSFDACPVSSNCEEGFIFVFVLLPFSMPCNLLLKVGNYILGKRYCVK